MAKLVVNTFGINGVNVDKNPFELGEGELTSAQNAVSVTTSGRASLRKRPGLLAFTTGSMAGSVLGGIGVPLQDLSASGQALRIYLGRGPTT